jgi:hypothetical protein
MFNDLAKLIKEIDLRFTSGNSIPIDRAHIKAAEYNLLRQALWDSYSPLLVTRGLSRKEISGE